MSKLALTLAAFGGLVLAQPFPTAEYTLHMEERVYNPAGVLIATSKHIEAQRADGTRAQVLDYPDGIQSRSVDFATTKGVTISVNDKNSLTSTMGDGKPHIPQPPDAACSNVLYTNETPLPSATHQGFKALRVFMARDIEESEKWAVPELGCPVVKTIFKWKNDDGSMSGAVTVQEAVKIIPGPPDKALFEIPTGAQDVPPSVYQHALHPTRALNPRIGVLDAKYEAFKKARGE